jgi:phage terminase large subunit
VHVIPAFDIPESWPRARGADYGSSAPWCCLWGAWDEDGNCYVYREAYGAGMTPEMQAAQANELSYRTDLSGTRTKEKYERTVADPAVFSDHRGAGRSVAQLWREHGFHVTRAKNDRVAGWANVRQYLWDYETMKPRLYVFNTCTNLTRTLPKMQYSKTNQEDLESKKTEDHAVDALRYLLATRPIGVREAPKKYGLTVDEKFQTMMRRIDKRKRPAWM